MSSLHSFYLACPEEYREFTRILAHPQFLRRHAIGKLEIQCNPPSFCHFRRQSHLKSFYAFFREALFKQHLPHTTHLHSLLWNFPSGQKGVTRKNNINNTSVPLSFKEAIDESFMPLLGEVLDLIKKMAADWAEIPMLAKTHGQPASPTRVGKEFNVFVVRLEEQIRQFKQLTYPAKFGGATGNMNAHKVAYPAVDWIQFGNEFVASLGLKRSFPTTQIEHYDNLASLFDCLRRINTILIDFARDIWTYISMEYFRQKVKAGEVGSSAMPHKVNPIDFENAEGNFGVANALYTHLSMKLPISRLQRDLTDSTVLRNIGMPLAHSMISLNSLKKGLGKLILNEDALRADLERNWAVVAEAIQTILRRENYPNPYETLKALTRTGAGINHEVIAEFIETLEVSESVKEELRVITPWTYTGF